LLLLSGCKPFDVSYFESDPVPPTPAQLTAPDPTSGISLATIRFDPPQPDDQQKLATAVRAARGRKPDVAFTVVAVTSPAGVAPTLAPVEAEAAAEQGRQQAVSIMRALMTLGVPPARITLAARSDPTVSSPEIRVYVR
jgi:hypothetical protein